MLGLEDQSICCSIKPIIESQARILICRVVRQSCGPLQLLSAVSLLTAGSSAKSLVHTEFGRIHTLTAVICKTKCGDGVAMPKTAYVMAARSIVDKHI